VKPGERVQLVGTWKRNGIVKLDNGTEVSGLASLWEPALEIEAVPYCLTYQGQVVGLRKRDIGDQRLYRITKRTPPHRHEWEVVITGDDTPSRVSCNGCSEWRAILGGNTV